MKQTIFMSLMTATLFFTSPSYADFIFYLSDSNACEDIQGDWSGKGKGTNWLIGDCIYHGTGTFSAVNSMGQFTVNTSAHKDSGSPLCPKHTNDQITGTCIGGVIRFKTVYGSLIGDFSNNTGHAKGTLSLSPGIDAEVSIQFQRVA